MSGPILPEPVDEEPRRYVAPPWARVQVEFVPTPLTLSRVLGVLTGDHALTFGGVAVYPAGVLFTLRLVPRPGGSEQDDELYGQMTGYGAAHLGERLRIGLRHADGRVATNREIHGPEGPEPPEAAIVIATSHGDGQVNESTHWAWPLPDAGDLEIVVAWPARALPETSVVLDGPTLRDAAARSRERAIWPGARLPAPTFLER